ncbi:methylmalonyl-CoA epimerase [mine drainage metagenome]|uniref:Methylmalonyl-CoA epimerase n=1 Tax=mine drainage metagenome TaxID=410659 RepID=T0YIA2_9ZZZZ
MHGAGEVGHIDHVGIAVRKIDEALGRWTPYLGSPIQPPELVPTQRVRVAFLKVGGSRIELLEPTEADSPVGRFLGQRGEGMHHLAFSVADVDAALAKVARSGGRLIDTQGRAGAGGHRVGFAHPATYGGVLVEFVEAHP